MTENWLSIATIPKGKAVRAPLPGTAEFARTKGREGDWVVLQIGSSIGQPPSRRASLRTLGLHGPGSTSLRSSNDRSTVGTIRSVRDLVAVVDLGGIYYKGAQYSSKSGDVRFDRTEYGTDRQPGQLVRDGAGHYFIYESDRRGCLLSWSTSLKAPDALNLLSDLLKISPSDPAYVATGEFATEVELEAKGLAEAVRSEEHLAFFQVRRQDLEVAWARPFKRFYDRDSEFSEITLASSEIDLDLARILAHSTGDREFFDAADCTVLLWRNGKLKRYSF